MRVEPFALKNLDALTSLAQRLNAVRQSGSSFCCAQAEAIRRDFEENMACSYGCWVCGTPVGLISCYPDPGKDNADCALLIDAARVPYAAAAEGLLTAAREKLGTNVRCTFFFPKENRDCAAFLEHIGAVRQVNEYCLLLHKSDWKKRAFHTVPQLLRPEDADDFAALHDSIFPDVYCSGQDILADLGKTRFVYTIRAEDRLAAYGVLNTAGGKRATAEIIGVRACFRRRGFGRAILNHLAESAFTQFKADQLDLIVDGDNEEAIALYLAAGFVIEQENNCYILY